MTDYSGLKRLADLALAGSQSEGEAFRSACRASVIGRLIDERDQLKAEVEALRKDAERYRWLRLRLPGKPYRIAAIVYSEGPERVDANVDSAMTKEQG